MSTAAVTAPQYRTETGPLGGRYVYAKLGTMRKERQWSIQPLDNGGLIIQTDGAIGIINTDGTARLTTRGGYFPHLALAKPVDLPAEFITTARSICQPQGATTVTPVATIAHTIATV